MRMWNFCGEVCLARREWFGWEVGEGELGIVSALSHFNKLQPKAANRVRCAACSLGNGTAFTTQSSLQLRLDHKQSHPPPTTPTPTALGQQWLTPSD